MALRRLLEGVRSNNLSCILTFIDFKEAFDTIHPGELMEIPHVYGVPEKLVAAIAYTYKTWANVRTHDEATDSSQFWQWHYRVAH